MDENSNNSSDSDSSISSISSEQSNNYSEPLKKKKRYKQFMYKDYNPLEVSSQTRTKYEQSINQLRNVQQTGSNEDNSQSKYIYACTENVHFNYIPI